ASSRPARQNTIQERKKKPCTYFAATTSITACPRPITVLLLSLVGKHPRSFIVNPSDSKYRPPFCTESCDSSPFLCWTFVQSFVHPSHRHLTFRALHQRGKKGMMHCICLDHPHLYQSFFLSHPS